MCCGMESCCWLSSAFPLMLILCSPQEEFIVSAWRKGSSSQTLLGWKFHRLLHSLIILRLLLRDSGLMGSLNESPFRFHSALWGLNWDRALRRFCLLPRYVGFPISYSFCSHFDLAKPDSNYCQRHLSSFFQCYIQKLLS